MPRPDGAEAVDCTSSPTGPMRMDTFIVEPTGSDVVVPIPDVLRLAMTAYLTRFKGQSRVHTESDLRAYVVWYDAAYMAAGT